MKTDKRGNIVVQKKKLEGIFAYKSPRNKGFISQSYWAIVWAFNKRRFFQNGFCHIALGSWCVEDRKHDVNNDYGLRLHHPIRSDPVLNPNEGS